MTWNEMKWNGMHEVKWNWWMERINELMKWLGGWMTEMNEWMDWMGQNAIKWNELGWTETN